MSQCKYCTAYRESVIRLKEGVRFCKVISKNVESNGKACEEFGLANTFWCVRNQQWLGPDVCKNRRMSQWKELKDWMECKKCEQWKEFTEQKRTRSRVETIPEVIPEVIPDEPKKRRSRNEG